MLKQGVFKIKKNFIDDIWTVTKSQEVAYFNRPFKRPRNQPCIWLPKINRYCPYFNSTVLLISMLLKLDPYILLKVIFLLQVGRSSTINPKVKVMNIIFHWLSIFQQFLLNNTVSCSGRAGWCSSFYGRWESESKFLLSVILWIFQQFLFSLRVCSTPFAGWYHSFYGVWESESKFLISFIYFYPLLHCFYQNLISHCLVSPYVQLYLMFVFPYWSRIFCFYWYNMTMTLV
jgi:hypothetical protein